jgi:hypothetical protein
MYYESPIQVLIFPVVSTYDVNQKLFPLISGTWLDNTKNPDLATLQ